MEFTHRPITSWPGPMTARRVRSQFSAGWGHTMELLERELRILGAKSVVLQVALREQDIRIDGRPKANAKATHPGVILSFESKHGPLSYPCDRFDSWDDNLRAIALSLEHLRAVDRYGVTRQGEQYSGWKKLPGPMAPKMSVGEASELIASNADGDGFTPNEVLASLDNFQAAYRCAAMATHPDRGGSAEAFNRVQEARRVIELAKGW